MAKGFFTQSAIVLFDGPVAVDALMALLAPLGASTRTDADTPSWMSRPSLLVPMRPEVNGYVVVDVVDEPWPDLMGDPQEQVELFGAWSMGFFGPWVFPGNLARAQAMCFSWRGATEVSSRHRAFVRIKSSYILGGADDAPVLPADYDPLAELKFVTDVARAVLKAPGALAYFNPNGEVLRSPAGVDEELAWHAEHDVLPLALWSNMRLFQLAPGWSVMDTLGMEQLDVTDHEACFPEGDYDPGEVDAFLRNVSLYVLARGPVIKPGDTVDGPGGVRWQAHPVENSLAPQPRPVLRWLPQDGSRPPLDAHGHGAS
ncbi:MAG: DUF4261 domain-containing protein [Myxococcales bacterium]|nr:DUF4261 domain-containing protein [Myxococcales bacterium]MCB9627919.1 DUF4261 domain-containing protein [Sandaracinaceae bacterium]